jgi:hypothetical protein
MGCEFVVSAKNCGTINGLATNEVIGVRQISDENGEGQ